MILAIDPGAVSGALAWLDSDLVAVADLPVVDGQLDAVTLHGILMRNFGETDAVIVERVGSMPKQGVASTFKFGVSVGIVHGLVAALRLPLHLVAPSVWKRGVGLPTGADKEASRALALRLYPKVMGLERKKDSGRAEALLIGHYWLNRGKS